ncbi:MAG: heparinase II/III family protein [Verrucomicrobiae bacterium]|nr:heparinase II/III family protein [Verrucomicrobiae bacterium]
MKPVSSLLFVLVAVAYAADPLAFGPAAAWKGGEPDATVRKVWPESVCWRHGKNSGVSLTFATPQDWSKFNAIAFWLHSEKATGSRFVLIFPSENPKSKGADYYQHTILLDWTGWKWFLLPFNELGVAREPLGWNHITSIRLTASGYGNTPDPAAVVRLDGIQLTARGPTGQRMTDAEFFANLDLDLPALTAVKEAVGANNLTAAKAALAAHLRSRMTPRWTVDWRQPAFRDKKNRPSRRTLEAAQKALEHKFDYTKGPGQKGTLDFGPKIDWTANPTAGEARTHLWNESLNRHFHFRALADAYWQTGDDKWAKEIANQILDWTASNPVPLLSSSNHRACKAWQTLTTGIRLADTWPYALYRCLGSPAFSDDAICAMLKSVCEQARHLVRWPTGGNWLTAESNGLYTAGVLFPEFKEAREWRRIALERLYKQLDDEVYPDGMEYELAAGYNNWVVREFAGILELADLNDRRDEVPADFQAKMEKMFNYLLLASMPNGQIPGLNDSGNSDVRALLETGFKLFPEREDFQFVATGGKSGRAPAQTSVALPWSGHYVMRSGWDKDATYLLFDAGPYGYAHQHEDKLHFVLWAHGRQLVLDPGNFSYDRSRWRRYVLSTAAHNTVMVDGQGQHRHGKKETHFWPRPWTTPAPPANDTRWTTTPEYDLAIGFYTDGYGPKNEIAVTHERRILYVKRENIFVVADTLTPRDDAEHRYEALFHLDAADATVDEPTKAVRTDGVAIVPQAGGDFAVEIVKGKEDEPVQGWASGPWRAIPTAIYRKSGKGVSQFLFVLEPFAKGTQPVVRRAEGSGTNVLAARIVFADGRVLEVASAVQADAVVLKR